jgi:hypothetical protein
MRKAINTEMRIRAGFLCGLVALLVFVGIGGCGSDPEPAKNRVPTVQAQLDQAQQAARDAKAAADQAVQSQKNIQDAIARLDGQGRNSDGSVKIGHPEISGVGSVTEVGETKVTISNSTTHLLWFTFAERSGFVKKFDFVCADQVIPVSKAVVMNYHWKEYTGSEDPGCYRIDSYTVVQ